MSDYSEKDTDWNFALAYLKRLDVLLQQCNYFKSISDYDNWLLSINSVHDEIFPRLEVVKKRDGTLVCDEFKEADALFDKAKNIIYYSRKGNVDSWLIRKTLSDYERFLREVLRKRGMDMPKKLDPGHSLLQG
jgi:hypothetical protein